MVEKERPDLMLRKFLAYTVVSGVSFMTCISQAAEERASKQPNVLFISIDDLNDWVGCMGGHPNAITPNIDKLAKRGTLFMNAHCQAPICGPSRSSVLTGLMPSSTGIYLQNGLSVKKAPKGRDGKAAIFLPEYFEKHGYKTMAAGKVFHTNGHNEFIFGEYGVKKDMGPKPEKRFNFDPAWFEDRVGSTQTDWAAYPEDETTMPDHKIASWAVETLAKNHEKPFFMAVGFCRPHVPLYAPQKWFDMHPLDKIQLPPYMEDDMKDVPKMGQQVNAAPMMPTTEWAKKEKQWKKIVQAYLACSTFVDHQVGRVLDALDKSGYAENTIVVLWSDHGYHLGEKNRVAKQALWHRATRVPLVIAAPTAAGGVKRGTKTGASVGLIDMYPTLLEMAGLPGNKANEGVSLAKLLKNPEAKWGRVAPICYGRTNFAMADKDYYFITYEDGSSELYNLVKDPNEWHNLAAKPEHKERIEKYRAMLPKSAVPLVEGSSYSKFSKYFDTREPKWRKP